MREVTQVKVRRVSAACLIVAGLAGAAGAAAGVQPLDAEAQEREIVSLAVVVGAALRGEIVPTEEPFGWANDFLKSSERTTFVPFTLSIEESRLTTPAVAMYLFVAPRGARAGSGSAALPRRRSRTGITSWSARRARTASTGSAGASGCRRASTTSTWR